MNGQDFDCNDGDGRCYDCPHTEQCDYYKYLLGERKDEGLTYFEKIQNEARNEEDWKLQICCDMMQEGLDYNQIIVTDGPMAIRTMLPLANGSCSINYCPWCGKHISFRRREE